MRSPKLLITPLLAASLVVALPSGASAAAAKKVAVPCYDASNGTWTYPTKPRTCPLYDPAAVEIVPFTISGLKWSKWGTKKSAGKGKAKTETYSGSTSIEASGLKRCSSTLSIYTRLKVTTPKFGQIALLTALPCPAA